MQHLVTLGCGPGGCGCGCSSNSQGFGSAGGRQRRFPRIESVLNAYVAQQIRDNQYFYLSPSLNSSVTPNSTFGGMGDAVDDLLASDQPWTTSYGVVGPAAGGSDPAVFPSVSEIASAIGTYIGGGGSPSSPPVSTLPAAIQGPVTQAAAQDLLGISDTTWLIGGAALLLIVVLAAGKPQRRGRAR